MSIEIEYEEKREGLAFSARVRLLASEAPDSFAARQVRKAATRLESYYGFKTSEKKDAICAYIRKCGGTSSIPELLKYFPWHEDTIRHLVGELEAENAVEFYDAEPAGKGPGRRARRIRLVPAVN